MDFIPKVPDDILEGFRQMNVELPDWFFNPVILFNQLERAREAKVESEARRNREVNEAFEKKKVEFEKRKKLLEMSIKNAKLQCELYENDKMTLELKAKAALLDSKLEEEKLKNRELSTQVESVCEEVMQLEAKKEKFKERLLKRRDTSLSILAYYKMLGCHIDYEPPYLFRVYPSDEDRSIWIQMRSDDFKFWEVLDATFDDETKNEMKRMLIETSNPALVVAAARKILVE